jgi:ABC-type siderophore export system fused ATPase/permease subunit
MTAFGNDKSSISSDIFIYKMMKKVFIEIIESYLKSIEKFQTVSVLLSFESRIKTMKN